MEQVEAQKFNIQLKLKDDFIKNEFDIYSDINVENRADLIDFYATNDRINKWKEKLIEKIKNSKNPFNIDISYYSEKYMVSKNKVVKAPEKFNNRVKNGTPDKVYYIREDLYNYHKRLDDHYHTYYILYDNNKLSEITHKDFFEILKNNGYDYGYNGMEQWEKDYPQNHVILDMDYYSSDRSYNLHDKKVLKQLFKIYN